MVRIVFIPSFGTNSSLYDSLKKTRLPEKQMLFTEWLPVSGCENFADYATNFIKSYDIKSDDILVGVSLGGVLAIEINKIQKVHKIIAISTILSKSEKPRIFRFLEFTKTYRLFSPRIMKLGLDAIIPLYGKNFSSYHWFRKVFKGSDNEFLKWSFKRIVCWENEEIPDNIVHIHGSNDPLFPYKNGSRINHKIERGTHAMIRFKAKEIAYIIKSEIT